MRSLYSSKNLLDFSSLVFIALLSIIIITIWIVGSARNMLQRSLVQFDIGLPQFGIASLLQSFLL